MTNHGKIALLVHGVLALVLTMVPRRHRPSHYVSNVDKQWGQVDMVHFVSVFIQNGMLVLLCQISFSYWTIIYPREPSSEWLSIQGHAINTIVSIIDVFISDVPFLMCTLFAYYTYGFVYVVVQVYLNCFTEMTFIYKNVIAWCDSKLRTYQLYKLLTQPQCCQSQPM